MNRFSQRLTQVLIFFLLVVPVDLPAQHYFENPFVFQCGINIRSITTDKNGFLWLAGNGGLRRFDGQNFKSFIHNPDDSLSILPGDIRHVYYDETNNKLWLSHWGSEIGGISVLDLTTEKSKNFPFDPNDPKSIPEKSFYWTLKDKFENIWLGTQNNGLLKYLPEKDSFETFPYLALSHEGNYPYNLLNRFETQTQDIFNDSLLWIGTGTGLLKFNVVTNQFHHFPLAKGLDDSRQVRSIHFHQNGKIYVGTWTAGLFIFDPAIQTFKRSNWSILGSKRGNLSLNIMHISPKSSHQLWIKLPHGMVEYDVLQDTIVQFWKNDLKNKKFYGAEYRDEQNRIYTWDGLQLFVYAPMRQQAKVFRIKPEKESHFLIFRRFTEEKETGKIWMAAQKGAGLYSLDINTGHWEVFPPNSDFLKTKEGFYAWDILRNRAGTLLILEEDKIYQFSEEQQKIIPYEIQPNITKPLYRRMIEDRQGNLWIGTYSKGLIKIDPTQKSVKIYWEELFQYTDLNSAGAIWDLQEDRNGNIWIRGKGCSVYDVKKDTFYNFPYLYPEEKRLLHSESLGMDKEGNVWAAFHPQDIGITDADHPEKGYVKYFTIENGLKTHKPKALKLGPKGHLWIGTWALEKVNSEDLSSKIFSGHYFPGGYIWSMDQLSGGRMILGHKKQVSVFYPDSLKIDTNRLQPYISSFKIFEEEQRTEFPLYRTKDLYLKSGENFFSFTISAINRSYFPKVKYEYKLEGIDPHWIDPGKRRYVSYTDIRPGTYAFQLIAKNRDNIVSDPYEIRIHIQAPWYQRWWAYALYLLLTFGVLYIIYHYQKRRWALKASLGVEQEKFQRLAEMDEFKSRLYANITHEFRTPLTVIQGLTQQLRENPRWKTGERLNLIDRNNQKLLQLINQLLGLSKLEAGKLKLDYVQGDIIKYFSYLIESLHSLAFSQKITLSYHPHIDKLVMDYDQEKCQQIISNLISNAIKFTPAYGKINVLAKVIVQENQQKCLQVLVQDTGVGIPKEKLPYIFDRFFQVDDSTSRKAEGTGIGLALVKELLVLMDGNILVESEVNRGTCFTFQLPIRNQAPLAANDVLVSVKPQIINAAHTTDLKARKIDHVPLILVVEDNEDVIYYLRSCLEHAYQIVEARNGQEGLSKALEVIPDLVISDVMMPEMDGFELCNVLKTDERTNHIPVILLTAKVAQKDKMEGLSQGADAYLAKPFQKEELLIRLEKLIELRRQLQQRYQGTDGKPKVPEDSFLQKVRAIVESKLQESDFNVVELSRDLGMSRVQLYRKVKALTGYSIAQYIRSIRLNKAYELLKHSDLTITEIGYTVGFKDPSYFSRTFSQQFGTSPSEIRK